MTGSLQMGVHKVLASQNSRSRLKNRDQIDLVSKPENVDNKSQSRLNARDCRTFFLGLVSKHEIKCQKFSVASRCARFNRRNSHSRLEIEKMILVDICYTLLTLLLYTAIHCLHFWHCWHCLYCSNCWQFLIRAVSRKYSKIWFRFTSEI